MMLYIAWFISLFTLLQLLIALSNLLFRSKLRKGAMREHPLVSVLIPARNEEKNITTLLNDLKNQDYRNIEIIVFNDHSTDRTGEIVKEFAATDGRISLINSQKPEEGWLGKNWACHSLSKIAKGEFFLFIDADVRIGNGLLINAVAYAKLFSLALLTIFPRQIIKSIGEKITVPLMNYILLSLLPLVMVRKSRFSSFAAANGQFMLFSSTVYKSLYPHEKMKSNKVEDIEIACYLKEKKYKMDCLTGDKTIQCRMYNGFKEAADGFSKNVPAFFGNSLVAALLFWLITTLGFLPVMLELPSIFFFCYLSVFLLTRIIISFESEQNIAENILLLIPQQLSLGLIIFYAFLYRNFKTYQWKGRDIK